MAAATSVAIASMAIAAASGGMAAYGAHQQGQAASRAASVKADMQRKKGMQELALSQGRASEERRQADLLQSEAITQSAAFGGGTMEKSTVDRLLDIETRGEYNALSQLYEGESRKQDLDYAAEATSYQGRSARRAGNMKAFGTVLDTASSMGSMYSKGGFGTSKTPAPKPKGGK